MGKSTTLKVIAQAFKHQYPSSWVSLIDLKQHARHFKLDKNYCSATTISHNFFSEKLLKIRSSIEQRLFKHFYSKGKVIFLFDGFDEISPNFKIFVLQLMKEQVQNNNIWVTTRLHLAWELEDYFSTSSFKLLPLTSNDQAEFLEKLLKVDKPEADVLMEKFKSSLRSRGKKDSFAGSNHRRNP